MSIDKLINEIKNREGPPVRIMEVCGTHTRVIFSCGIHELLPANVSLISGPGCPVCVTPAAYIDRLVSLSMRENCVVSSFGDMIRVPGNATSLQEAKAAGGDVRIFYSPAEVLELAKREPSKIFYIAAVGFETTLPVYALLVERIMESGLENIRLVTAVKSIIPALYWICGSDPDIDGFIGPGHVSTIIGWGAYEKLCSEYGIPITVAGFDFEHIVVAICDLLRQIKSGSGEVHNLYPTAVLREGNTKALTLISKYFVKKSAVWRGLGSIEESGYYLAPEYAFLDGGSDFDDAPYTEKNSCLCGKVIIGRAKPSDCKLYGKVCRPESPAGPCMVSAEGTCGIWYSSGRQTMR